MCFMQISDVNDLRGKAVVTVAPYVDRLYSNHRIVATDKEGTCALCCLSRTPGYYQLT